MLILLTFFGAAQPTVSRLSCSGMYVGGPAGQHNNIGSTTSYSINVLRGSTSLVNGGTYIPGETLSVSLSSTPNQYAIEVTGATFVSGGTCQGKRKNNGGGTITLPATGSGTVTIKAIAGTAKYSSVNMLSSITLSEQAPSPTPQPSVAPTGPSEAPTMQPTPIPTTSQPTSTPTNSTFTNATDETEILGADVIAAIVILAFLPLGAFSYYQHHRSKSSMKVAVEEEILESVYEKNKKVELANKGNTTNSNSSKSKKKKKSYSEESKESSMV